MDTYRIVPLEERRARFDKALNFAKEALPYVMGVFNKEEKVVNLLLAYRLIAAAILVIGDDTVAEELMKNPELGKQLAAINSAAVKLNSELTTVSPQQQQQAISSNVVFVDFKTGKISNDQNSDVPKC